MNYQLTVCEPGDRKRIIVRSILIEANRVPHIGELLEFVMEFPDKLGRNHTLCTKVQVIAIKSMVYWSASASTPHFGQSRLCAVTAEPVSKQYRKSMARLKEFMKDKR